MTRVKKMRVQKVVHIPSSNSLILDMTRISVYNGSHEVIK